MTENTFVRKPITQTFFKHQPSLIPSNPDAPPPDVYLLEHQIPIWCQTALTQASDSKSPINRQGSNGNQAITSQSSANSSTQNKARVHACRALLKVAEDRPDLRKAMILSRGLIETIVLILQEDESGNHAVKRCQQLLIVLLSTLLLTEPQLDQYLIFEPGMTDAIAKQLLNSDREIQNGIAVIFDYICVAEENRTLVCGTDHMIFGIVQLLHNTKSIDAREHALQGLLYLSEVPENRFLIARQSGLLEAMAISLFYQQVSILAKTLLIIHNILLLKENIPCVATQKELCERLQIVMRNASITLFKNNQMELGDDFEDNNNYLNDDFQPFLPASTHYDFLPKEESKIPFQYEKEIFRMCFIILQLVFKFDTRLNSKLILEGTDYTSQDRIVIQNPGEEYTSTSILANFNTRKQQRQITTPNKRISLEGRPSL